MLQHTLKRLSYSIELLLHFLSITSWACCADLFLGSLLICSLESYNYISKSWNRVDWLLSLYSQISKIFGYSSFYIFLINFRIVVSMYKEFFWGFDRYYIKSKIKCKSNKTNAGLVYWKLYNSDERNLRKYKEMDRNTMFIIWKTQHR